MDLLSCMFKAIQGVVIPHLEETFGSLTNKQKHLVSILEVVRIEEAIPVCNGIGPHVNRRGKLTQDRRRKLTHPRWFLGGAWGPGRGWNGGSP